MLLSPVIHCTLSSSHLWHLSCACKSISFLNSNGCFHVSLYLCPFTRSSILRSFKKELSVNQPQELSGSLLDFADDLLDNSALVDASNNELLDTFISEHLGSTICSRFIIVLCLASWLIAFRYSQLLGPEFPFWSWLWALCYWNLADHTLIQAY